MYEILKKQRLSQDITLMVIKAPIVAQTAEPGQFIILPVDSRGERIPLTIADFDRQNGTITIIYQIVGATTLKLDKLNQGDKLLDFVGPLGKPTKTEGIEKALVIGGGVGCAIALPVAKKLKNQDAKVDCITGFARKESVVLQDEFAAVSDNLYLMTDDGSAGEKGLVTKKLNQLLESGEKYDEVFAIGPILMMKFVSQITKQYNIKTTVSMNPIMIDGTGMCGACRLTVGGEVKFACVDGPDFDGHLVDYDEALKRNKMYRDKEIEMYNKLNEQVKDNISAYL